MTIWSESNFLRESVQRELDNWGLWSRGGGTNLGYPDSVPGAGSPERDPSPAIRTGQAERTEHILSTWSATTNRGRRLAFILKLRYVENQPLEAIATHYRAKFGERLEKADVEIKLDNAEMGYWLLAQ